MKSAFASRLIAAAFLPWCAPALAADLQQELAKCAVIADVSARVACYDTLARPQSAPPRNRPDEVRKAESPAPPIARVPSENQAADTLVSTVTALNEDQPNKLRITLANGQVWKQTVGKPFFIRAGDTVRIAGSGWGRSFRLSVDGHPDYVQVSRLK